MYKRGNIVWVRDSRTTRGSVQKGDRPAIIVSNNTNNTNASTYEIVYLTTQPKKDLPTHVIIRSANEPSIALCEQINTVSDMQVAKLMGVCTASEMMAIEQALLISLGIDIITLDNKIREQKPLEIIEELPKQNTDVHIQLIKAQKEAEIYQKLYTELLQKTLDK